MSLSLIKSVSS